MKQIYKSYIITIVIFFTAVSTFGFEPGKININTGVGAFGSRGILGVSLDKFITENHAISLATGFDFIGPTTTLGWKYFDTSIQKNNKTGTFLDKCFFLFECESHPYLGIGIQYGSNTTVEFRENELSRNYNVSQSLLGIASFGFRDEFSNHLTFDVEITYRSLFSGGQIRQVDGLANNSDLKNLEAPFHTVGLGIGIGYIF